mmetsp:Transcript_90441/g.156704  ORF Transcript_90441/g.156704 Transcript_90441/m.156704 type:complete len:81 (-) Transcript_90441:303-545(-)
MVSHPVSYILQSFTLHAMQHSSLHSCWHCHVHSKEHILCPGLHRAAQDVFSSILDCCVHRVPEATALEHLPCIDLGKQSS